MTNFLDENYLQTILRDLSALRACVRRMLVGGQLVDVMELICGDQYTLEKAEAAARTGWTTDSVHPSRLTVAKIGLHLIEKMGNYMPVGGNGETSGKRAAAVSTSRQDSRPEKKPGENRASRMTECLSGLPEAKAGRKGVAAEGGMYTGGRGGHNSGRNSESSGYGGQSAGFNNQQRDGYYYPGFSGRGPKGGGGSGYRGWQYRGGADRWGHPY
jgi:hypothetical protein